MSSWAFPDEPVAPAAVRGFLVQPGRPALLRSEPDYQLDGTYVSREGSTTAWIANAPCRLCQIGLPRTNITVERNGEAYRFNGDSIAISRNGRYVFRGNVSFSNLTSVVEDLDTGRARSVRHAYRPVHALQSIADNGTLISTCFPPGGEPESPNNIRVTRPNAAPGRLFATARLTSGAISADAAHVFAVQQLASGAYRLSEIPGPGQETILLEWDVPIR